MGEKPMGRTEQSEDPPAASEVTLNEPGVKYAGADPGPQGVTINGDGVK
jgi:hypothetical protein